MARRGRPPKTEDGNIHKVSYYKPNPEMAVKALQKVHRERLVKGYTELLRLGFNTAPTPLDMAIINKTIRELGF
jgi:hypothetical protein